ncbi:MAG: DUF5683 domain-containing protein [Bacteroidales bacterium]|jgi:hypothetical protein
MHVIAANITKRASLKFLLLACILITILLPSVQLNAQTSDTVKAPKKDTVKNKVTSDTNKIKVKAHSPKKAMLFSACLPGLGQAYNKKCWKIPIIYVGAAAITYYAIRNLDSLKIYTNAYKNKANGNLSAIDNFHNQYDLSDLQTLKTDYKRLTDITFILAGVLYALNIIDATVDAYMFNYDLSDDLSMHVIPAFYASRNYSYTGLSFSFTFGKHLKQPLFHKEGK